MIRLGLFGGTFDPVHYGHLRPVAAARRELDLPRVLMICNPQPPHKQTAALTPYRHRREMLRLALIEFPGLELSNLEETGEGPAYTTDTVSRLLARLPADEPRELWLLVGADALLELPRWRNPEALFNKTSVAVLPRPGIDLQAVDPAYMRRVRVLRTPLVDVSASAIRLGCIGNAPASDDVPAAVMQYIREHGLYRN